MRALLLAVWVTLLPLQAQPKIQRFTLPNGLRVLHLEDHEHPLVRVRLLLRIDPGDTPSGRQGLSLLLLRMLGHAETADLKAEDLDRLLEESGIQLVSSLNPEGLSWQLVARSRDQDRALGLLGDRLLRTLFSSSVLMTQRLAAAQLVEAPGDLPQDRLQQALQGDPATRPTQASLGAITVEDLLAFHAKVVRPDRAVVVLHGDLGLEQAKRLVLLNLGTWTAQEPPAHSVQALPIDPDTPTPTPGSPSRMPLPGSDLRIQALAPRPGDLSPETASLLALLIPGDARLQPVRMTLANRQLLATLDAEPGTAASAWSLFQGRLASFRDRGFTQADLDRARRAWLAGRSLDSLHPEAQMESALAEVLGLGVAEARVKELTLEQLNAGLRAWLDPAAFRIGAAGDPEDLKVLPKP